MLVPAVQGGGVSHTAPHSPLTLLVTDCHSASPFMRRCICTSGSAPQQGTQQPWRTWGREGAAGFFSEHAHTRTRGRLLLLLLPVRGNAAPGTTEQGTWCYTRTR